MKKIINVTLILAILFTSINAMYVKAEDCSEKVNPDIIYACNDFLDDFDISKAKVVDNSIYYLYKNEYICLEFFNTEEFAINATEITVKDYIDGIPVTSVAGTMINYIDEKCFLKLTKINLPNTIKEIEACAFSKFKNLTHINLPNSLTKIDSHAFNGLKKIKKLSLPDSITYIGDSAFANTGITNINIPRSLKKLEESFACMKKLKSITIPKEIKHVGYAAFEGCKNLSKVKFESDNIRYIGERAFYNCKSLKKFNFPKGVKSIGDYAFANSGLTGKVTLPKKCSYLGEGAFTECKNITKLCLKNKDMFFYHMSLDGCTNLKSISGAKNITKYAEYVYGGCSSLESFTVSKKIRYILDDCFIGCKSMKKFKILTTNVKEFEKGAFKDFPKNCKIYVKNNKIKNIVRKTGFKGSIIVNKKLK